MSLLSTSAAVGAPVPIRAEPVGFGALPPVADATSGVVASRVDPTSSVGTRARLDPDSLRDQAAPLARTLLDPVALDRLATALAATAAEVDRAAVFPAANFEDLRRGGWIGAVVPRLAGGGGASLTTARRVIGAIGGAEAATALILAMTWLVHRQLARPGSPWPARLRDAVWRSAVEDGALANALRVEPDLGTPARGGIPETIARRTADGWRLSGHKRYATGAAGLRWLLVHARTDGVLPDVGTFVVPADRPGIEIIECWDGLGLRASASDDVVFDDVAIPFDHAVDLRPPAAWGGAADADQTGWMVSLIGALYDGVARSARDWYLAFLATRVPANLGRPLSTLPRFQQQVGEIEALLATNATLLDRLAADVDAGRPPSPIASGLVKQTVTANAIRAVGLAVEGAANPGLSRSQPLERHLRDVLCSRVHTPQDDASFVAAGREAIGPVG